MTTQAQTHTPGPWTVARSESRDGGITSIRYALHQRDGKHIADLYGFIDEVEANARLIAAAPRMHSALDLLLCVVAEYEDDIDRQADRGDNGAAEAQAIIREARAALAQARGA